MGLPAATMTDLLLFRLTFESPRFELCSTRSRKLAGFPKRAPRNRQVGIHANRRQEILPFFQRAVLLFPVIWTVGAVVSELCAWQGWTIGMNGARSPVFLADIYREAV
jgi:hypothetical protein